MLDRLLSIIAPHICSSCGAENALLCGYCFSDIVESGFEQCVACLAPTAQDNLCGACRRHTPFDTAWVVGERSEGLRELIDRYKFDRAREGADVLARLLAARTPVFPANTVVTYIPSISGHRRQRGYDHMKLIAHRFAQHKGLTAAPLLRRQTSLSQRGATKQDRLTRQRGAFVVDRPVDTPVLLIDDIYTTGATIRAGVEALRAVGSQPVYVAVVARQPFQE